jgi:hypothetical protein
MSGCPTYKCTIEPQCAICMSSSLCSRCSYRPRRCTTANGIHLIKMPSIRNWHRLSGLDKDPCTKYPASRCWRVSQTDYLWEDPLNLSHLPAVDREHTSVWTTKVSLTNASIASSNSVATRSPHSPCSFRCSATGADSHQFPAIRNCVIVQHHRMVLPRQPDNTVST